MLWTEDTTGTVAFYRDRLGFQCHVQMGRWASLERDGVEVMLSMPNQHEAYGRPQFSGSFYFRCDDVDSWWERLKDTTTVVYPIENFDYGMREFAIRDNNGYILQFGKEIG
jgi:uncharacterized glyoxalase superfamily protein PhnB